MFIFCDVNEFCRAKLLAEFEAGGAGERVETQKVFYNRPSASPASKSRSK